MVSYSHNGAVSTVKRRIIIDYDVLMSLAPACDEIVMCLYRFQSSNE